MGKAKETPLIVMGPGTLGQGSQCAASRNVGTFLGLSLTLNWADGSSDSLSTAIQEGHIDPTKLSRLNPAEFAADYEAAVAYDLIRQGYRVFVVDYIDWREHCATELRQQY